jgi:hypothetical protein
MSQTNVVTRDSWKEILASAVTIFADLEIEAARRFMQSAGSR